MLTQKCTRNVCGPLGTILKVLVGVNSYIYIYVRGRNLAAIKNLFVFVSKLGPRIGHDPCPPSRDSGSKAGVDSTMDPESWDVECQVCEPGTDVVDSASLAGKQMNRSPVVTTCYESRRSLLSVKVHLSQHPSPFVTACYESKQSLLSIEFHLSICHKMP